jgi:hypothetical protein
MIYLIRYTHPETGELITHQQHETPSPTLKVPLYSHRGIFSEPDDLSKPVIRIAEYECRLNYTTCSGERIYDYWRIR